MRLADYSQVVTAAQLDAALRAGQFEGVFHYFGGDFALRVEALAVVAEIRARGWPQAGVFVPRAPASVDGTRDAGIASAYGHPPGRRLYLDVEPVVFDQDPGGWAAAADAWCDGIRLGGYSPGVYGVDRTTAACANRADTIWRATPGQCDPAGPGLAADFFAGRRIAQCGNGTWGGVEFDVSYSQFNLEAVMTQGQLEEMVDNWYWTLLGRPVESDAARQGWVARIAPDGSNAREVRDQFAVTDEALAYASKVAAIKAGTLPPGTVVADTTLRSYLRGGPQ